jgi:hypothetical protein
VLDLSSHDICLVVNVCLNSGTKNRAHAEIGTKSMSHAAILKIITVNNESQEMMAFCGRIRNSIQGV